MVGFWIRAGATGLKTIKGVKPGTKFKGQKTISKVKSDASKAGLESAKFHLGRTFSKTDKSLKKLKETTEETKRYLLNLPPKKKK